MRTRDWMGMAWFGLMALFMVFGAALIGGRVPAGIVAVLMGGIIGFGRIMAGSEGGREG
jgi:hypothetical protein